MDFEKIRELIKLVDSSDLAFFELQLNNEHIKMDKSFNRGLNENNTKVIEENKFLQNVSNKTVTEPEKATDVVGKNTDEVSNITGQIIKSPMVGTFYSSTSPEAEDFVKEGDKISKGKVICIIEAMKLMNEIESEFNGTVLKCLVKDGEMVEYGQPLFEIGEE